MVEYLFLEIFHFPVMVTMLLGMSFQSTMVSGRIELR